MGQTVRTASSAMRSGSSAVEQELPSPSRAPYCGVEKHRLTVFTDPAEETARLRALATDAARELDVLREDSDTFSVDRAEVGVLEETDEVRLGSLLKRQHGVALEAEIGLRIVGMGIRLKFSQRKYSRGHTV